MKGKIISSLALLTAVFCDLAASSSSSLSRAKALHKATDLTDPQLKGLAQRTDMKHFNQVLNEILVPRVVGTPQHTKVANFIANQMQNLGWSVERDVFRDHTPTHGELEFQNIITKLNPSADRYLVLACHFDSKYTRENTFVGATDSAVPCAMMINLAKTMYRELSEHKNNRDVSLAFIFFDGEEAFKEWTATDSIYGARHLAKKWESEQSQLQDGGYASHIDKIDVLVLLDLLGAKNPKFYSYFTNTEKWYLRLVDAEERLSEMGQLRGYSPRNKYFQPRAVYGGIQDDHIPFMERNVPILHIIPSPFPSVWHRPSDNRKALDMNTIENLNKIFRSFVAEYLGFTL